MWPVRGAKNKVTDRWQKLFLDASKEPYATTFKGKGSSRLMSQFASMLKSKRASNAAAAKESGVVELQLTGDEAILVRKNLSYLAFYWGTAYHYCCTSGASTATEKSQTFASNKLELGSSQCSNDQYGMVLVRCFPHLMRNTFRACCSCVG